MGAQVEVEGPALLSHRMGGIGAEVHQHLLYLGRVSQDACPTRFSTWF